VSQHVSDLLLIHNREVDGAWKMVVQVLARGPCVDHQRVVRQGTDT